MDKKFIEENKFNETIEHFQHLAEYKHPKQSLKNLYEYSFITHRNVNEEGEEDQQPQGDMQPQNDATDAQNQMGGMDAQAGGEMPPESTEMPQDGNMEQPPMDGQQQMDGEMPMGDEMGAPEDEIETTEMEPDDEVIDVDELTQSQEATEYKIDGVDDRLTQIFKVVEKFADQLDKNEQSINDLKDEFEKRNPTQTEKFNLRSQASGPFNQTPTEYWDKLTQENPNYEVMRDNEVSPSEEQKKY